MFEFDFLVVCDGGSREVGMVNDGYGSYYLESRDGRKQTVRLEFGRGVTNNEAEYRTLIAGLKDLAGRIRMAGKATADYAVVVHTDSQLVVGQLRQNWKVKAANLRPLVDEAGALADAFGRCDIVKVPRDEIVRVLGH